jgi:nucleotide-binding universal stress UspA family protein
MQFRKIVVGIDFSDASLAAARWVADHLAPNAELLLVHVVSLPRPPIYLYEQLAPTIDQRSTLAPRLYAALSAFGELLGNDRVRVGVRTGVAWSALARVANQVKADLICVGRGNKRKGSSRFGATTPQRLLAVAGVPVLVIPQGVATKPNRVLAALSGRPGGERVLPVAEQLASAWGASLEGIHVIEADVRRVLAASPRLLAAQQYFASASSENERRIGIDSLDEAKLRELASGWLASTFATAGPSVPYEGQVRIGDAGQELITTVRDKPGPAVIVLGRVGENLTGLPLQSQYRCGSTTRMVLWAAPCPVFVVPLERREARVFAVQTPDGMFDARLPMQFMDDRTPALASVRGYSQNGNDAA